MPLTAAFLDCGLTWVFGKDDTPIGLIGGNAWPDDEWRVWMLATDDFDKVGLKVTSFVRRAMIPGLLKSGSKRAFCWSIDGHEKAHRWIKWLGAKEKRVMRGHGRHGEDFVEFEWWRNDVHGRWSAEGQ